MDEVCEQALRLIRNESVHPLLTAVLPEFRVEAASQEHEDSSKSDKLKKS